jgi:hypothetical protein
MSSQLARLRSDAVSKRWYLVFLLRAALHGVVKAAASSIARSSPSLSGL